MERFKVAGRFTIRGYDHIAVGDQLMYDEVKNVLIILGKGKKFDKITRGYMDEWLGRERIVSMGKSVDTPVLTPAVKSDISTKKNTEAEDEAEIVAMESEAMKIDAVESPKIAEKLDSPKAEFKASIKEATKKG